MRWVDSRWWCFLLYEVESKRYEHSLPSISSHSLYVSIFLCFPNLSSVVLSGYWLSASSFSSGRGIASSHLVQSLLVLFILFSVLFHFCVASSITRHSSALIFLLFFTEIITSSPFPYACHLFTYLSIYHFQKFRLLSPLARPFSVLSE